VNDSSFKVFRSLEARTRQLLIATTSCQEIKFIDEIASEENVQVNYWRMVLTDVIDEFGIATEDCGDVDHDARVCYSPTGWRTINV
jgi:hypothetical protein